jgi:ribose 5-phosphate isomerase A
MVDDTKLVTSLGQFPLPIEVIPMARSYVARKILEIGGDPVYRQGYVTDNGNNILDIHHLHPIKSAREVEEKINHIAGVVANGIFSIRRADVVLAGTADGIKIIKSD